ncbi:putative DUF1524 family protein [Actinoalloteichus hymeniacidonis]|uniref:DUF1524 family protein n=2 Tax=Actinoalloteichus hymeniacidonis TaxID=340345 RepID=A0AAC9MZ61_9PSEU|nr:putative DUF1524 family protein [Actinoalloteichus hymeniacidonis]
MDGYSRELFPHWISWGDRCNTRELVLIRDGSDVEVDQECRAVTGTWWSVYDDVEVSPASGVDIDHMVPLAAAWRSGADEWDTARRRQFANDLEAPQLFAVSARSNRSKGDQTPADWVPPATGYHCTYAVHWTEVKTRYDLTITDDEQAALSGMLDTCP